MQNTVYLVEFQVLSLLYTWKESEEMKITVCNDVSHKTQRQTIDELSWSRRGEPVKVCVCVRAHPCLYKVLPCYMNLFLKYVPVCYRPLSRPRLILSVGPNSSWTVRWIRINRSSKSCASPVNPFGSHSTFQKRLFPLSRSLLANSHEHKD